MDTKIHENIQSIGCNVANEEIMKDYSEIKVEEIEILENLTGENDPYEQFNHEQMIKTEDSSDDFGTDYYNEINPKRAGRSPNIPDETDVAESIPCDMKNILPKDSLDKPSDADSRSKSHKCQLCNYATKQKTDLQRHIDSVHLNLKRFECPHCDYACSQKGRLKRHAESVHLNLKKYKCHLCDYLANHKFNLKKHILIMHLNMKNKYEASKKHACTFCDYTCYRNADLQKHINSRHLKLKMYKCHLCEHASNRKENLKIHIDSVHLNLKGYRCHLCDYAANHKLSLKKHLEKAHCNL